MIPLMKAECVDVFGWMTEREFLDALALGNALPGPIAAKMSIVVGHAAAGPPGAAVAFVAVMGPSMALMAALLAVYLRVKDHPAVQGAMVAVKPVVVGMLAWTALDLAPAGIDGWVAALLCAVTVAVLLLGAHPAFVIASALVLGALFFRGS